MPEVSFVPALGRIVGALVAGCLLGAPALAARADVAADTRALIENQRRILVLKEAGPAQRTEARRAGQYLFFENHRIGAALVLEIERPPQEAPARYLEFAKVLDDPAYADEDLLVLRGPLERLAATLPPEERADARKRLARLAALRRILGADFQAALQQVPLKPARVVSPRWSAYVERLTRAAAPEQILAELDRALAGSFEPGEDLADAAALARVLEWNGEELPPRTILLTFDDGPHALHTPAILDILRSEGVHAVFFQIGRNLGEVLGGNAVPGPNRDVEARLVAEGHAVGNHSFTHAVLPKLALDGVAKEIADTQLLIEAMVGAQQSRTRGMRPPYGARNDKVLAQIDRHGLRSVVWNIDSEDWADPLPESIAHRVVLEAERSDRGIVLMHDIHARTAEALPIVIRELKKRGFRFAHWDGSKITPD